MIKNTFTEKIKEYCPVSSWRKYSAYCTESISRSISYANVVNFFILAFSLFTLFCKFVLGALDNMPTDYVLTAYLPSIIIPFFLYLSVSVLAKKKPGLVFPLQMLVYAIISLPVWWGIYGIVVSHIYLGKSDFYFWMGGLIAYSGACAIIPAFSFFNSVFFYILSVFLFSHFNVDVGENMPANTLFMYTIAVIISRIRFKHEYLEYVSQQKLLELSENMRRMKEEAEQANSAKSRFLAHVSHEIRTPINAILGENEMIFRESTQKEIVEYSNTIASSGKVLLSLINDILDHSKLEAGKMDLLIEEYSLAELITALKPMVKFRADSKGLKTEYIICDDTPDTLVGDSTRITQILTNILTNAVKYTEHGCVTFKLSHEITDDSHLNLIVSVKDTGIGMKKEDLEHLTDSFSRFDAKRNKNVEGTGLGMGITAGLLELMNGRMEVESEYGKGSVFTITIPQEYRKGDTASSHLNDKESKTSATDRTQYKPLFTAPEAKILVVDDTSLNLMVAKALLKETKVQVTTAASAAEMFDCVSREYFDIIFLDHLMPNMDGIEALHQMKKMNHLCTDTPVIALTANADIGTRNMYLNEGFDDYLSKPVNPETYEQLVMQYLPKDKYRVCQ